MIVEVPLFRAYGTGSPLLDCRVARLPEPAPAVANEPKSSPLLPAALDNGRITAYSGNRQTRP
jgi:hypothetical protein